MTNRSSAVAALFVLLTVSSISAQVPQAKHVFLIVEENQSYSSIIGNPAMPFVNGLAARYALAMQYYANTHPSIGNYFMLTTGQILTNDDSSTSTVDADNIVRELILAGKTWKCYAENLPYPGYVGTDAYPYIEHHNPFSYFSDVRGSGVQAANLVPFSQFTSDLASGQLPDFSFIVPNNLNDGHDGSLPALDAWLSQNLSPLLNNPAFQQNGLVVIVFDESFMADAAYGGGQVAMIVAGPQVKPGYRSSTLYQHQNTLKMISEALGLPAAPGVAAGAADMAEFFAVGGDGVQVSAPQAGSTVHSPVQFAASASSSLPITGMRIYVDGNSVTAAYTGNIAALVPLAPGNHFVVVQAWDSAGRIYESPFTITVE